MALLLTVTHRWSAFRAIWNDRRRVGFLALAAIVITINWGTFIYGVTHDKVIETSLGYFINPLVTVLLGVIVLRERLRRVQWVAIGIAAVAVIGLTIDYGQPPWVAFLLAGSFGTYGLMKKKAGVDAVESLTFETLVLTPIAFGYLLFLSAQGTANFTGHGVEHSLLLASTGLVTAIPLLCFGAAAIRVSLTTIGLLQYLAPTIQFVLGILVFDEVMTPVKWFGFSLVWLALAIFTTEAVRHRSRQLRLAAEASAL